MQPHVRVFFIIWTGVYSPLYEWGKGYFCDTWTGVFNSSWNVKRRMNFSWTVKWHAVKCEITHLNFSWTGNCEDPSLYPHHMWATTDVDNNKLMICFFPRLQNDFNDLWWFSLNYYDFSLDHMRICHDWWRILMMRLIADSYQVFEDFSTEI